MLRVAYASEHAPRESPTPGDPGDVVELPGPDDFHIHLRQGPELAGYVRTVAASCRRALVMPNTLPPITTPDRLLAYRRKILAAVDSAEVQTGGFEPLLTFKLLDSLDPDDVAALARSGAVAGKLYPEGVTTNAEDGLRDPGQAHELYAALEAASLVLCVHAEAPSSGVLEREADFLPVVESIVARHPSLRVVVEHVSDARTVAFVREMPDTVAATVTVHHLLYTIEDLLGSGIRPHLYCKPLLKRAADRDAIAEVVLSGEGKFFYGSDSAPHPRPSKECACGAAGVYSAPTAIPLLIDFFERHGALGLLGPFVGAFGASFYRLPPPAAATRFVRSTWRVPEMVDGVVPLGAGTELAWRLEA
jgi:dihydroorotase